MTTTSPSPQSTIDGPSVLIIGIGNEIRNDDAVGLEVVRRVEERLAATTKSVTVKTLSAGGWQLLHEVEGYDELIVVDAYFSETTVPGRVRIHRSDETPPIRDIDAASAHLLSIPDALRLSERHGFHTPKLLGVVTVDVGPNCYTFGTGLSKSVKTAVKPATEAVLSLLEK